MCKRRIRSIWQLPIIISALATLILLIMLFSAKQPTKSLVNVDTDFLLEEPGNYDWRLQLVNANHRLPQDYNVILVSLVNGLEVDERCYRDLQAMLDACRAEGLEPVVCSAYRSYNRQNELFQNKVAEFAAYGFGVEQAEIEAAKVVALPGSSEHQLGLAVDIVDINNQILDDSQEQTPVQKWLQAHSWEYGFIMRYPSNKSEITGIIYEPWHYRYVGQEVAQSIFEQELCLEEYLNLVSVKKESLP